MTKNAKIFGFAGLGGAALLLIGIIAAMASFERGVYSPASCFVTELGQYTGGYLFVSSALYFNIGLVVFGFAFGLLMIVRGGRGETTLSAAIGFTGALTGILAAAQGIFTLNYTQYHYIVVTAFYLSAFVFCVLQIVEALRGGEKRRFGTASLIVAFAAGALCLASGTFMLMGGMARVFFEDVQGAGRLLVVPFALIGLFAVAAVWAQGILLSLDTALIPVRAVEEKAPPRGKKDTRNNDFAL
jgi:hypothetical protein